MALAGTASSRCGAELYHPLARCLSLSRPGLEALDAANVPVAAMVELLAPGPLIGAI